MNANPYSERVRELFARPAHAGEMATPHRAFIADQGVRIAFSATLSGAVIERLRFQAWGCPHVIAAAEWVCTQLEGRPATDLQTFAVADLMQSLAVPMEKSGRILVIEDAVRALGAAISKTFTNTEQD
ncbi:MAG: iron-sulfur cluster assembly scaffold protein [Proteobacteria bacterium]|nr:iron-sulfur cluster assembly scaffold protein [Pseudomonadota bacterium]